MDLHVHYGDVDCSWEAIFENRKKERKDLLLCTSDVASLAAVLRSNTAPCLSEDTER